MRIEKPESAEHQLRSVDFPVHNPTLYYKEAQMGENSLNIITLALFLLQL